MSRVDLEVVIRGHERYAQGFIRGLFIGQHTHWWPVFHAEFGIEGETLAEALKEWVGLAEPVSRFVIPEAAFETVLAALRDPRALGLKLVEARPIRSATFSLDAAVYSEAVGEQVKAILQRIPPSVSIEGWRPAEVVDPDSSGVELYSPAHDYQLKGKASISGPFRDVLYMHEQCRRVSQVAETKLHLERGEPRDLG